MGTGNGRGVPSCERGADLVNIARSRARSQPSDRAFLFLRDAEDRHERLDYAGLDRRARRVAAALRADLGAAVHGARVLLLHPAGLAPIADFLGCLYAGAIAVPTAPPRPHRAMERTQALANDSGAAAVLTVGSVLAQRERIAARTPALARLHWLATDQLPEGLEDDWREHRPRPDDLAFLQYTSGSTGTPKGVAVSHANLAHNEELLRHAFRNGPDSTIVSWLPLHHDMGLIGMVLQAVWVGAPCVLMAPADFLARPLRWIEAMALHRGTMSCAPNFAYDLCAERAAVEGVAGLDLSTWEMAVNGAEPVRLDTLERFARTFAPCGFRREALHPGFGLAEGTLIVSLGLDDRGPVHRWVDADALASGHAVAVAPETTGAKPLVGCGVTMRDQEIAIVDPATHRRLEDGAVGEIWVRGPSVATGYWNRPDESAATFRARLADGEGPFLRTGDLGFLEDGELFVAGRRKDLIIVRGQNHYPQDLELAAEQGHDDLRGSGAAAFAVELGGRERVVLVCEVERRGRHHADAILAGVRGALAEACEVEAGAVALIRPGSLPRTSSGKVRRRATRDAWLAGELALVAEWRAPDVAGSPGTAAPRRDAPGAPPAPAERTPRALEEWLARLLAHDLGVPLATLDTSAPLAALGLDSLRAVRLSHAVERAYGTPIPLARLHDGASLRNLAADLARDDARTSPGSGAEDLGDPRASTELSFGQRSLWFLQRLAPESRAYHLAVAARVLAPLDPAALERAFSALVERHAALRTGVDLGPDGEPRAVPCERAPALELLDATGCDDAALRERAQELLGRPYDLARGPLVRLVLLRRGDAPDVLALGAHHLVLDQGSLATLLAELGELLDAERAGRAPALPPAVAGDAFARRQRAWLASPAGEAAWQFWSRELADAPEPAAPPADRRRGSAPRQRGRTLRTTLAPELAARLANFARERGVTPYVVALAAFETLLARLCGRDAFTFGTLSAGRSAASLERAVGYLVNPLVQRADLGGAPSFATLVERARRRSARCLAHADFPFPLLVERLRPARDASGTPFVRALLVWQHPEDGVAGDLGALALGLGGARVDVGGLALESLELEPGSAQFDLSLTLAPLGAPDAEPTLAAALEFDVDVLTPNSAERLVRQFAHVLAAALDDPDRRATELPLDEDEEPTEALCTGAALDVPADATLQALLGARAAERPDATALFCDGRRVSRAELRARVDRLAGRLLENGAGAETIVAVHAGRSLERTVALLACDAVCAAWMPVDPELPAARRRLLVDDARASLVVAPSALAAREPRADLVLDESTPVGDVAPVAPCEASPQAAAYVMHTSGSTGVPKGVVVPRGALLAHALSAVRALELGPRDVVLHDASVGFDLCVEELFPALVAGATVVVRTEAAAPSVDELEKLVTREGVTVLDLPTAYWHVWTASLAARGVRPPAGLRLVIVGGERASSASLAAWRAVAGDRPRWVNTYGPTETTVTATLFDPANGLDPDAEIPIGRPVPGWRAGVLERVGRRAPAGVPGELVVGGAGVARGYLGDPRLTASCFAPDPDAPLPGARVYLTGDRARWLDDGQLEFLGRRDAQVKVSGFRVDPAEVEAELARLPDVAEAVVAARAEGDGPSRLCAWVVTASEPETLRRLLAERLPRHLVPVRVVCLDALPRTPAGKVDRRALPTPPALAGEGSAPRGDAEATLAALFEELLGVERVGPGDGFFELGGDSIRSIQLCARAARAGLRLTPRDVFQHPRLADLARAATVAATPAEAAQDSSGAVVPLAPIQRWLLEQELERPDHWNQHVLLALDGHCEASTLRAGLLDLARRHDALRLRFRREGGAWHALAAEAASAVAVEAVDLRGLGPPERDAARARATARAQTGLDLTRGPLLRAVLAREEERTLLLLVAHHLVVDAVSWRLLVDELEEHLAAQAAGRPPAIAPAPTTWRAWAQWTARRARELAVDELALEELAAAPGPLGLAGPGRERDEVRTRVALDGDATARFEHAARDSGASEEELLVTALAAALVDVGGHAEAWIEVEAHGREPAGGPDVARTVGWFTELHQTRLDLTGAVTPQARLRAVRRDLARARRRGPARWLARGVGETPESEALRALPAAEVSFNYLGRLDGALERGRLSLVDAGRDRAPAGRRTHALEIDARVQDGVLVVDWFSIEAARPRVERLAAAFRAQLRELTDVRGETDAPALDLIELDDGQLADVLRQVGPAETPPGGGR